MKLISYLKSTLSGLYNSFKRFPLTILLSVSVAAVLISISETKPIGDNLSRIAMTLALGIPASLCVKLFIERMDKIGKLKIVLLNIALLLILFLYYLFLLKTLNTVEISRYIGTFLTLFLCFVFIPYLPGKEKFEFYVITLLTNFFITLIYSLVLFSGLSSILFTIDKLLGITIQSKIYYYTWLIVIFLFAVTYFLAGVPIKGQCDERKPYPKLLSILLLYIVMPLLTAYTIILYIYFGKIIFTRQWPQGLITNLVLWYSLITAAVLFFIQPIRQEKVWSSKFFRYIPKVILPLLIMMFISIFIRINAYGITEKRYYVIAMAIWVTFVMLYYAFSKPLRSILLPVTLSLVAFLSVYGPISSFSISKLSQNSRFEGLLIKNKMIINGKIQPSADIPSYDKNQISSILDYFNRNHSLKNVKYLPENFKLEDMNSVFGFSFQNENYTRYDYFNFIRNTNGEGIDIKGYDYLFDARSLNSEKVSGQSLVQASYNYETAVLKIKLNEKDVYSRDLNTFVEQLLSKYESGNQENVLPPEEMTITDENDKLAVKIIFMNISGSRNTPSKTVEAKGIDFYLAVKIK